MFSQKAESKAPTLEELLSGSSATDGFKESLREFESNHRLNDRIQKAAGSNPPVKILRVIMKLIEAEPSLAVDSIKIEGSSGCSDYRGRLEVTDAEGQIVVFDFVWDCAWRAREEGWKTFFGEPDQQKAAQVFGYQCFQRFERAS